MQNVGVNGIVATIRNAKSAHPTGMVVFFLKHSYDSEGFCTDAAPPQACASAEVFAQTEPGHTPSDYKLAGISLTDTMTDRMPSSRRATVNISGSVAFCNTGPYSINAGAEVWARISEDGSNYGVPETIARMPQDTVAHLTDDGYVFVGMCLMGCEASQLSGIP